MFARSQASRCIVFDVMLCDIHRYCMGYYRLWARRVRGENPSVGSGCTLVSLRFMT